MRKLYVSFMRNITFTQYKLSFHLDHVMILSSMEFVNTINYFFRGNSSKNNINIKNMMKKNSANRTAEKYRVKIGG